MKIKIKGRLPVQSVPQSANKKDPEKKVWVDVEDAQRSGVYLKCKNCSKEILSGSERCSHCNHKLK